MSKRPVMLLLDDILGALKNIEAYSAGLEAEAFEKDGKTVDAVVRNLEVVGEASSRLPREFQQKHPEIEWHKIIGLRHRIVHDYFGIDLKIVWQILQHDLKSFRKSMEKIRAGNP